LPGLHPATRIPLPRGRAHDLSRNSYTFQVVSPASCGTIRRVLASNRNRRAYKRSRTGVMAWTMPRSFGNNKRPYVPQISNSNARAYPRASRSSNRSRTLGGGARPGTGTSFRPYPGRVTRGGSVRSRTAPLSTGKWRASFFLFCHHRFGDEYLPEERRQEFRHAGLVQVLQRRKITDDVGHRQDPVGVAPRSVGMRQLRSRLI